MDCWSLEVSLKPGLTFPQIRMDHVTKLCSSDLASQDYCESYQSDSNRRGQEVNSGAHWPSHPQWHPDGPIQ